MPPGVKPSRRFPPPWTVEERPACFIISDANGQALAYVYYEEESSRRTAGKLMTYDEARRIAATSCRSCQGRARTKSEVSRTQRPGGWQYPLLP